MRKVLFLLSQLSDSDLDWMISHGQRQRVAAGTVLIHEGRDIDMLYVLLDGVWEVTGSRLGGQPIRLSCGEVVGEMSMLDSRPPVATVTAATNSTVLAIPRLDLKIKCEEDSDFAARFYRSLAIFLVHRLRNTYRRFEYGKNQPMDEETEYEDELSPELLDSVHVAATRFDRALQRLLTS
jgi:CRP/FNR family transcriptional regulator, cyclic AMP receptor protein